MTQDDVSNNLAINESIPVYTNITSTFSGIGHVIVDLNSLVYNALSQYHMDVKSLPTQTIYLHFQFLTQNLRKYQLKNISLFYEYTEDEYFNILLRSINQEAQEYSHIKDTINNKRIALALSCNNRVILNDFFLKSGIYVGITDSLSFQVPFIYTLVYRPYSLLDPNTDYGTSNNSSVGTSIEKSELTNDDLIKAQDLFFNFEMDLKEIQTPISVVDAAFIFSQNIVYIDGRILQFIKNPEVYAKLKQHTEESTRLECQGDGITHNSPIEKPWTGRDLELIIPPIQKPVTAKHLANLRRSAMSLYDGKFHYSSVVKGTKSVEKISAKMQKIINENELRLKTEARKKDDIWLKAFFNQFSKLPNLKEKKALLDYTKTKNEYINRRVLLLKIEVYSTIWNLERRKDDIDEAQILPVYLQCMAYLDTYTLENFNNDEIDFVISKLFEAGFESTCLELLEMLSNSKNNALPRAKKNEPVESDEDKMKRLLSNLPMTNELISNCKSKKTPNDFDLYIQLKHGGEYLKRTLGTKKDKRVPFDPDQWQVELLDAVDAFKTAVISAPTSSGKTFICFYAIEKILKNSDSDVVVFCLPTKALVNQVSSDVYARFNPKNIKVSLQGTLMPDRTNDPFNCQVLITIPSMLESLLNSNNSVRSKIKYIIIDEIHKINDSKYGLNIERIIHIAKCPMLLLSATLGNLETFYSWVHRIEAGKGRECTLVIHNERYCELKSYVYSTNAIAEKSSERGKELIPLNNMFAYSFNHLKTFGFGNDLHFLPDELLNIYYYIYMVLSDDKKKLIRNLAPKKFFKSNILCKKDIRGYQLHLLTTFETWVKSGILTESQVEQVHTLLTKDAVDAFPLDTSEQYLMDNILDLLFELKNNNMLPVIVFNIDRDFVTRLAKHVYKQLEMMDKKKKKDKAVEKFMKEVKRNRDQEKTKNSWIDDSILEEQTMEIRPEERDINYTFLDPLTKLTDYDISEEMSGVHKMPKEILDMAYRGIGIHHSAMNRTYRAAMEILFRKKHVRVLFATDTLALGINMPCRTTVFAGDSLYLDPMNYKQMSGRAGRRGYDTLGNVVFFGISKTRAQNLMVSNLPEIQGAYTYSNTSITAFSNIEDSLIKNPLMVSETKDIRSQAKGDGDNCIDKMEILDETDIANKISNLSIDSKLPSEDILKHVKCTLDCLDTVEKRKILVEHQKKIYEFIYPSNYLWDLQISNRELDPAIFIFSYLYHEDALSYETNDFITTVAYMFENVPMEPTFPHLLGSLYPKTKKVVDKFNNDYFVNFNKFATVPLKNLQSYSSSPLLIMKSFLTSSTLPLNSYILDFYNHGSTHKINTLNRIGTGQLWAVLTNIIIFLNSFVRMLTELQDPRLKLVTAMFDELNDKYKNIFA